MKSGVYQILNLINGKRYIGSTINFNNRLKEHRCSLLGNYHKNKHLQNAYNKYGIENFETTIIEYCEKEQLESREQYWMDFYGFENIYNNRPLAFTNRGRKMSPEHALAKRLLRHTEATKKIISDSSKRMVKTDSFKLLDPEVRKKQVVALSKVLTGKPSWNKGSKGVMKPNNTSFKKGITPWNKGATGGEHISHQKAFELVSPNMILYIGSGIFSFAKEMRLTTGINNVINNKWTFHKGWRLPKEGDIYEGYGFFGDIKTAI